MGEEQKPETSTDHLYKEIMSNRLMFVLFIIFYVWARVKFNLSALTVLLFILGTWALGDGLIHKAEKINQFVKGIRYG